MPETKMMEIARQLARVSQEGKVTWESRTPNSYRANFPEMSLQIFRTSAADYLLTLTNEKGEDVESLYISTSDRDQPQYSLLREIYNLARGQSLDIEGNIEQALDFLTST